MLFLALIVVALTHRKCESINEKHKRNINHLKQFFHVSDTHLDIYYGSNISKKNYQGCRNKFRLGDKNHTILPSNTNASFGRAGCDTSELLLKSAAAEMKRINRELVNPVEFVLITG